MISRLRTMFHKTQSNTRSAYREERRKLLRLITSIRDSHQDMEKLYLYGQCYNFASILRSQFPGGDYWYAYIEGHMYYHFKGRWYDIRGEHLKCPKSSTIYNFKDGDPAYRWGRRDKRKLI